PRELRNRPFSLVTVLFWLLGRSSAPMRRINSSLSPSRLNRRRNHRYLRYKFVTQENVVPPRTASDLISPPCSVTATEIVSAWTSNPTNFILFIDRLLSLVALYCLSSDSQHNPRLRIGAGHSIVTIRDFSPIAFSGCPRGHRVSRKTWCPKHVQPNGVMDTHPRTRAS